MKTCTKCNESKPLDSFSTNKKASDGRHSWCRSCVNSAKREAQGKYLFTQRLYVQNNAEKIAAYDAARRTTDTFKKMKSLSDKNYRDKMGELLKEKKRQYYADKQHLRRAEYQRNKQGYIARAYQRLHKIKCLTPADACKKRIQFFYDEAKRLTALTGIKHEVDHVIPVSRGGLHHQDNLQILPWIENRTKGNKL